MSDRYEVEIRKLPTCLVGGYLAIRYKWEVWALDDESDRRHRASFVEPLRSSGQSFTKWGARRDARRTIRKDIAYYAQEPDRVVITVSGGSPS